MEIGVTSELQFIGTSSFMESRFNHHSVRRLTINHDVMMIDMTKESREGEINSTCKLN